MTNEKYDKRWVYKMYFPVPRLTTSPATMIISICSSEMKRPPTQNWLKNCDFRKISKIASKTVTFERSLELAQRLWLFNIPKFWNGLEWWWKIAASLLFCFLEGVYAWYFMPSWNIMYDRSYYDFCMLALILSFLCTVILKMRTYVFYFIIFPNYFCLKCCLSVASLHKLKA